MRQAEAAILQCSLNHPSMLQLVFIAASHLTLAALHLLQLAFKLGELGTEIVERERQSGHFVG